MRSLTGRVACAIALSTLSLYRIIVSPLLSAVLGHACRFDPTCSVYAHDAIANHGVARGAWLAIRRLLRCRPGGGWGYDPAPHTGSIAQL
ncbi:MAG: membrane protein insertion efficiency factor YidD [Candidatus Binataceae bacterium]|nr:membrane protein insertion efficiency factor YidD [Candidatus Binataceae bacterium]